MTYSITSIVIPVDRSVAMSCITASISLRFGPGHHFVEQQETWLRRERLRHFQPLADRHRCADSPADRVDHRRGQPAPAPRQPAQTLLACSRVASGRQKAPDDYVLTNGHARKRAGHLEGARNSQRGDDIGQAADRLTGQPNHARRWARTRRKSGLREWSSHGAVGADEPDDLAFVNVEIEIIHAASPQSAGSPSRRRAGFEPQIAPRQ